MKIFFIVIFFIVLLMFSSTFFISYQNEKLIESCNDLGYEKLIQYQSKMFCLDDEGYFHEVVRTENRYKLIELKFRGEVLG